MDFILGLGSDTRDLTMWKSFRTLVPLSPFPVPLSPVPRSPFPVPIIKSPHSTELTGGCAGIGAADIQKLKSAGICTVYVSPLLSHNTQPPPAALQDFHPLLRNLMPPRQISHARLCLYCELRGI